MNTKFLLLFSLFIVILISSCSKDDDDDILPEFILSEYEIDVIDYFKDIALGFECMSSNKSGLFQI